MTVPTDPAEYKCTKCHHEYTGNTGATMCPKCGCLYVEWVNYNSWYSKSETKKYIERRMKCQKKQK